MKRHVFAIAALASVNGVASAHHHITVDTFSTSKGEQIVIRPGYLPAESEFAIDKDGRLLHKGKIAVIQVLDQLTQGGEFHNWYAGAELLLTSDYYFATGRLDGGNFMYELASISPVSGGPGVIAWGGFKNGPFEVSARSDGPNALERSYNTYFGGHEHDQGYALSTPGLYDVTLIAWDSNGVYLDSEPVVVRFQVGEPTCPADFDGDGFVTGIDFDLYVAAFEAGDVTPDFDGDGFITGIDFDLFVGAYEIGC